MSRKFKGVVSSRSSKSADGPPGERVILELNPERRQRLLELTSWPSLYPGSLNVEVDEPVTDLLLESEALWIEDARTVRYPDQWRHIPERRKAYLYFKGIAAAGESSIDVVLRRAAVPVPRRVELFADRSIRGALNLADGDTLSIELDNGAEILQAMKLEWREQERFFSNRGKEDRERWVVAEFLRLRAIPFEHEELHCPEQSHSTDVEFRDARFQVKEIATPETRRQREITEIYRRVEEAKRLQDTIGPAYGYDTPPIVAGDRILYRVVEQLSQDPRYRASKSTTDLIFYVTHAGFSLPAQWTADWATLTQFGWRSISCLIKDVALVLAATDSAPVFLQQ